MPIAYADSAINMGTLGTSQTTSKNFGNVANGYLAIGVRTNSARTVTGITWNGTSMTQLNTPGALGGWKMWWFGTCDGAI